MGNEFQETNDQALVVVEEENEETGGIVNIESVSAL